MFTYNFDYTNTGEPDLVGQLELEKPQLFQHSKLDGDLQYRRGKVRLKNGRSLEIFPVHGPKTAEFMYLSQVKKNSAYQQLLGLAEGFVSDEMLTVAGQFVFGGQRTAIAGAGVQEILANPSIQTWLQTIAQNQLITVPILREGMKYQITEGLFSLYGYYVDEVITDAHHVEDRSIPNYQRRVETTLFSDRDISQKQRKKIQSALVADSIAGGVVMIGTIQNIRKHFPNCQQIQVIAPLCALRGLARILAYTQPDVKIQVYVFETLINPLAPDYYFSPHFSDPNFHIRPDLEKEYRNWWGQDKQGNWLADTACAGYGWSEGFLNPPKQIRMMDEELQQRHNMSVQEVIERRIK